MSITDTVRALHSRGLRAADKLASLAPLLLRLTVGLVFASTGWGKLHGLEDVTSFFETLGIPLPGLNAAVVASTEFFGGILILIGLGTRLVALPLAFTMVVAIATAKWSEVNGVVALAGFPETSYLVMFLTLALIGPGVISLDAVLTRWFTRRKGAALPQPLLHPAPTQTSA